MNQRSRQELNRGFTLIELVVVMAILAILAAIVIPRYSTVQQESRVKADVTTATAIIDAARVQELNTGSAVTGIDNLDSKYFIMTSPQPQSGGSFALGKASGAYKVTWTATGEKAGEYADTYTVTEGNSVPKGKLYDPATT